MSEKKFAFNVNKYQFEKDGKYFAHLDVVDSHKVVDKLNEQQDTIKQLKEMNERLREINKKLGDDLYNCRLNKKKHNK